MPSRACPTCCCGQAGCRSSAIFSWAIKQEIITVNPCKLVDRNPTTDRERVLSDEEVRLLWEKLDPALKLILLTGQRPGEIAAMQREHIIEDCWQMPGKPQGAWPGTKNGRNHRVALSEPAQSRKALGRPELVWDLKQPGTLSVRPTSKKAWKVIYRFHGRPRWLHLGDARAIGLADARRLAARVMLDASQRTKTRRPSGGQSA